MTDCPHALVVETEEASYHPDSFGELHRWRSCLDCGLVYDRTAYLRKLERAIRDRCRLPPSPWSSAERGDDD